MPEGPELFLAGQYVNRVCGGLVFSGKVEKSEISATQGGDQKPMDLVFRFGMSGSFKMVPVAEMPKHAHLRFYTKEKPLRVLCYVDVRRFGRWEVDGSWQADRGPCVMLEYEKFRENVLRNLSDKAFNKPICEALLNQKYFSGIGNYLRAEILYRLKIPPFEKARTVLEKLQHREETSGLTLSKKVKLKRENPDLLELCHMVPMEVINLGGKGYEPGRSEDYTAFVGWLQCYYVPGMKSLRDSNGRTIWFQGDPGPMAPKGNKSRKKQSQVKTDPGASKEKSRKKQLTVKTDADTSNPKVRKPVARKKSRTTSPPKAVEEARKPRKKPGTKTVKKVEDAAMANGTKTPNTRSKRKSAALQESPATDSESQKCRASSQKNRGKAAATTRARRGKAQ
ncbi:endonuclease 8-like 1 isoform X2 [Sceloporus undulatus]|uniref:endonuclease 8-like 1 isoform X2 n=1 Tax=Sceloporus undulatus TaxID=8520 RepID=UPI001C4C20C0|nr:endonuclease 8-like 1 isoform X2 [Sceloporus undulatus]XP_042330394.1 endonuclease 8-like 1 isoform X2 [Sceloporus undulatus]XP_042330395.1 endonuclease 8-like 1 isoform X2 [Sceloporus undulatus]